MNRSWVRKRLPLRLFRRRGHDCLLHRAAPSPMLRQRLSVRSHPRWLSATIGRALTARCASAVLNRSRNERRASGRFIGSSPAHGTAAGGMDASGGVPGCHVRVRPSGSSMSVANASWMGWRVTASMESGHQFVGKMVRERIVDGEPALFLETQDSSTDVELRDAGQAVGRLRRHRGPGRGCGAGGTDPAV